MDLLSVVAAAEEAVTRPTLPPQMLEPTLPPLVTLTAPGMLTQSNPRVVEAT